MVPAEARHRILVVDDNSAIHDDIRKILAPATDQELELELLAHDLFDSSSELPVMSHRFSVDSAFQGQEALAKVKAAEAEGTRYTLAFVDVRMPPGWDGVETIGRLWQVDPNLQVVLCTAYSDHLWKDMSKRLQRLDHWLVLKKPFDSVEVLQVAHALAGKWDVSAQLSGKFSDLEKLVQARTVELQGLNEKLTHEIDERKLAEENLRHMATHDTLTGIANRLLLRDRCGLAIARARRFKSMLGVMLLDLDRFKEINDGIGHDAGDALLKAVAGRLSKCARESDTVARLGGDEFVILLSDLADESGAKVVAERILKSLAAPVRFRDVDLKIGTSIGVCLYPRDAEDSEGLLKCADVAMYEAKQSGRGQYKFYMPGAASRQSEHATVRDELRVAVANEELFLLFQPLVTLGDSHIIGMEALVRWRHPRLGVLEAMRFLPMAEEIGVLSAIGKWVLQTACKQNAAWQRAGYAAVPIGVNLSAFELEQDGFVETVAGVLRETGLPARYLEIEVNETAAARDQRRATTVLARLHELGVRIVIDDFGSGWGALHMLRQLPISALKVDRLFIKNITQDPRDAGVAAAIIGFANAVGIPVVAEGIETKAQLTWLSGMRSASDNRPQCESGQGYLFSKPVLVEDAERLLRDGLAGTRES